MLFKDTNHTDRVTSRFDLCDPNSTVLVSVPSEKILTYKLEAGRPINPTDGVFEPGILRLLPYHVYSESTAFKASDCYASIEVSGGYKYKMQDVGPIGLTPLASVDSKFPAPNFLNLPEQALLKALGKVRGSDVSGGENLGELRETINLLRHPFKDLRDYLSNKQWNKLGLLEKLEHYLSHGHWIGGKRRSAIGAADAAAGAILEFRYGLMPLIGSINDVIELVNKKAVSVFDPARIRRKRTRLLHETAQKANGSTFGYHYISYKPKLSCLDKMQVSTAVYYTMTCPETLLEQLGLTPNYAPELWWELTRLSFVVDWAFAVGDWLGSLRYKPGVTILGNCVGKKVERTYTVDLTPVYPSQGPQVAPTVCGGTKTRREFTRVINQATPFFPPFTHLTPMGLSQAVDSVALIWQQLLSKLVKKRR